MKTGVRPPPTRGQLGLSDAGRGGEGSPAGLGVSTAFQIPGLRPSGLQIHEAVSFLSRRVCDSGTVVGLCATLEKHLASCRPVGRA